MLVKESVTKITGLTLLETMFALAVGTLVLIGTIVVYQSAKFNTDVSKTMTDMNAIRTGYKSYLVSGYKFDSTLSDTAQLQAVQNAGFLPSPLNDAWGQAYTVSVNNSRYPGYIVIGIPPLDVATNQPKYNMCYSIYKVVQTTGGLSTALGTMTGINCAFRYRFP